MSYNDDLRRGELGEDAVHAFMHDTYDYEIEYVNRRAQRAGLDAIYTNPHTGRRTSVSIKTDERAGDTENVFIETVSVHQDGVDVKPGWGYMCKADVILIWLPRQRLLLVLMPARLADVVDEWSKRYLLKRVPNDGYETLGIAVPIEQVEAVSEKVIPIP